MKQAYLILLNLIAIFEIRGVKTRYVLIEIVKEQEAIVSSRGQRCPKPPSPNNPGSEKFACKSKPTERRLDETDEWYTENTIALTCALDENDYCDGNHIIYTVRKDDSGKDYLELDMVDATLCEPKPKKCHCNTMLPKVLKKNKKVKWIEGYFTANPFIAGCRCYLGVAAKKGFKFVEIEADPPKSFKFTKKTYVNICKLMEKEVPEDLTENPVKAKITKKLV